MATIDVLVTNQGVAARQNRVDADRGETVTWSFQPNSEIFQVVFKHFQPPVGPLQRSVQGPFSQALPPAAGQVVGIIGQEAQDGLYVYDIHNADGRLEWLNPISDTLTFGGLDVPRPPGGGGSLVNKTALDADEAAPSADDEAATRAEKAALRAEKAATRAEKAASRYVAS